MSRREDRPVVVSRATWCIGRNGYADDSFGCDTATDHDHYDVALDADGKVLFRYWPIGTTFLTEKGYRMRVRGYQQDFDDLLAAADRDEERQSVPPRPTWDGWTPDGGAFGEGNWLPGPEDRVIEFVVEGRPAPGALFLRPNGESWRLRSYGVDWTDEEDFSHKRPSWSVNLPSGASTNGDDLPDDARLVWHP